MSPMPSFSHTSKTSYEEIQFEWELSDYFLNDITRIHADIDSRTFRFGRSWWKLVLRQGSASDSEHLFIDKLTTNKELKVEYKIGLKKTDGSVEQFFTDMRDVVECGLLVCTIPKSEMLKRKYELAPPNGLTIMCILRRGAAQQFVLPQAPPMKLIGKLRIRFKYISHNVIKT